MVSFGDVTGLPCSEEAKAAATRLGPPWYATTTGMLDPALWWVHNTPYGIFPLTEANSGGDNAGKTPILKGGQNDPSRCLRDAGDVATVWSSRPWCNIGLAVNLNRLLVIDVDPRDGGVQSMRDLADEAKIDLADVPRQETPNRDGGMHLFWRLPDDAPEIRKRSPLDGIDIPWQVPIAPSLRHVQVGTSHKGVPEMGYRPYTWAAGDPRELPIAPAGLIDLLGELGSVKGRTPSRAGSSRFPVLSLDMTELLAHGIPHGQQNNTIFALATSMARRSVGYDEAVEMLWAILQVSPQDSRAPWERSFVQELVARQYGFIHQAREQEARQAAEYAAAMRRSIASMLGS